jgi:hypothetical protein
VLDEFRGALDLRTLALSVAALCCMSSIALAQSHGRRVIAIHSGPPVTTIASIVVPPGSKLELLSSVSPTGDIQAAFRGQVTLSGIYKVEGYGADTMLTLWPDRNSRDSLPHWQDRDVPEEMDLSNGWAFAKAVVPSDKLRGLRSGKLKSVKGRVTIIADKYETSIDCDVVSASARFVSVVKNVQIAANPQEAETC